MKDQIVRKAAFCIELRDALTNKIIESQDISVHAKGYPESVKKENKYYLFWGTDNRQAEISIHSLLYEEKHCLVFFGEMQEKREEECLPDWRMREETGIPIVSITLYPNTAYALPAGYKRVMIEGEPLEEIRVIKNKENVFLLADDYQMGETIQILMKAGETIENLPLRIVEKEGEEYEDFVITGHKENFQYSMERALKGRYSKGSKIYELYCAKADRDGKAAVIMKML